MNKYKIEFLKNGIIIDSIQTSLETVEEIETKVSDYKKHSYCKEVKEAKNIEWRIVEIIEQVVKRGTI